MKFLDDKTVLSSRNFIILPPYHDNKTLLDKMIKHHADTMTKPSRNWHLVYLGDGMGCQATLDSSGCDLPRLMISWGMIAHDLGF